eukprot:354449-Chlamydomonas_euryale.AAC.9
MPSYLPGTPVALPPPQLLDGEKIVSRKRGFTVESCTTAISVADEDALGPQFQGVPIGEKVRDGVELARCEGLQQLPPDVPIRGHTCICQRGLGQHSVRVCVSAAAAVRQRCHTARTPCFIPCFPAFH